MNKQTQTRMMSKETKDYIYKIRDHRAKMILKHNDKIKEAWDMVLGAIYNVLLKEGYYEKNLELYFKKNWRV